MNGILRVTALEAGATGFAGLAPVTYRSAPAEHGSDDHMPPIQCIVRAGASGSALCLFDGLGNHDQRFDMRDPKHFRSRGWLVGVLFDCLEVFEHVAI
jgi:hypothetical protein